MSFSEMGFDTFATLAVTFLSLGFVTEIAKAIISSISGRSERRRVEAKRKLLKEEVNARAVMYWREVAYDLRRIAIEAGIPREDLPKLEPPTVPDDWTP